MVTKKERARSAAGGSQTKPHTAQTHRQAVMHGGDIGDEPDLLHGVGRAHPPLDALRDALLDGEDGTAPPESRNKARSAHRI